jgi:PadR family transcriptional regulator, regulatory protein PadR
MARSGDALQGALPMLVLKILARRGPLHGYAITSQIEAMSSEVLRVQEGSLYPALHRLEESGWVKAKWVVTANKRRARVYDITAAGRRQLEAEETRWRLVTLAVGEILDQI